MIRISNYTIKIDRSSATGVSKGYPAALAHQNWDDRYPMYGGDICSKAGEIALQLSDASGVQVAMLGYGLVGVTYQWYGLALYSGFYKVINNGVLGSATAVPTSTELNLAKGILVYPVSAVVQTFNFYITTFASGAGITHGAVTNLGLGNPSSITIYRSLYQGGYLYFYVQYTSTPFLGAPTVYNQLVKTSATGTSNDNNVTNVDAAALGDLWRIGDALWVKNIDDHIEVSTDLGANWSELSGGDGSTDYTCIATDQTYVYATLAGSTVIWRGTIDSTDITWTSWFDVGSTYTLNGMDADELGHYVVGLVSGTGSKLVFVESSITINPSSVRVIRRINTVPSQAILTLKDNALLQSNLDRIRIYDKDDVERFRGIPLPAADQFTLRAEGIDRELRTLMVNHEFDAQTCHEMGDWLGDGNEMSIGTNNLADLTDYDQVWGGSMPRDAALTTICIMESDGSPASNPAGYWRTKVSTIDLYLDNAPNSSGKTLTWGTTSAELLSERPAIGKPINKLIVYGAYSTTGLLQYTVEDTDDQLLHGIIPAQITRNDLQSFAAVKAFAEELFSQRTMNQVIPKIYTVKLYGRVWLNTGDSISVASGSLVSDTMSDGDYIVISNDVDLLQGISILELSAVTGSEQKDYSDALPISAQVPVSGSDSTSGDTIVQTSFASLLGAKWNDLIIPMASGKLPASNYPDWSAFTTNTSAYKFDVDEYIDLPPVEFDHGWIEGSTIKPHVHIVLSAATASEQKVQFTLYYSWGDVNEVMDAETSVSGELTVPNATADKTHLSIPLTDIAGTNKKIDSILNMRLKRVAKSAGGNELAAQPFVLSFGIHVEYDAMGSNEVYVK